MFWEETNPWNQNKFQKKVDFFFLIFFFWGDFFVVTTSELKAQFMEEYIW